MSNWYKIVASAGEQKNAKAPNKSADVYLFDYIGGWEVTAKRFMQQINALDVEHINLHINSPGGYVFDGVAIQNVLKQHKATVTVYIDGLAASIASVIALAGDEILIADNAYVMIHNPWSVVLGEAKDMLKEAELLDKITEGIAGDYARYMNITVEEARALMDAETWYLGQEAVDAGFASDTYEGIKAAAAWGDSPMDQKFDLKHVSTKAPADVIERFSRIVRVENKSLAPKTKKENDMPKEKEGVLETPKNDGNADVNGGGAEDAGAVVDAAPVEKPVDVDAVVDAAVKAALVADRKRADEITALGEKFGFTASAKAFVSDGKTVDEFRAHILNQTPEDWKAALEVKNPALQASEADEKTAGQKKTDAAVDEIKARRAEKHGA